MADFQNFRSAIGGFNREDVVHYIEYMNNKHAAQLNQLNTELQALQTELAALRSESREHCSQAAQLQEAQDKIVQLEQELESARNAANTAVPAAPTDSELEAYRRAERMERLAAERVAQLYNQANAALAEATARTDESSAQVGQLADGLSLQISQLLRAINASKNTLQNAAATMYAISPAASEEE